MSLKFSEKIMGWLFGKTLLIRAFNTHIKLVMVLFDPCLVFRKMTEQIFCPYFNPCIYYKNVFRVDLFSRTSKTKRFCVD